MRNDRLGMWYAWIMVCSTVWTATAEPSGTMFLFATGSSAFIRFLCTLAFQIQVPTVSFWHLIYHVSAIYSYSGVSNQCGVPLNMFAVFEMTQAATLVFCAYWASKFTWASASQEVQTAMLQGSSSAMSTLLDLVCDVSFELDADLKLKDDVPKFSAMVTLGSTASIQGLPFTSCMAHADDVELFKQRMHEQPHAGIGSSSVAGLHRVKLRDSLGNHVDTEVFYVRYDNIGTTSFLVGLRECGEHSIGELKSFPKQQARRQSGRRVASKGSPANAPITIGHREESGDSDSASIGAESDTSSMSSVPSLASDASTLNHMRPTQRRATVYAVRKAMKNWVLPEDRQPSCCSFHGALAELEIIVLTLTTCLCDPTFRHGDRKQCHKCGTLGMVSSGDSTVDWMCRLCGHTNAASVLSSTPLEDRGETNFQSL
eukprot:CAMPEP_0204210460 /NCGR_PEP_ID=MMETSP0361-20130328/73940_1 /ASSEMBLY_ACC=CAM_ASM_000343 /TAXON_ID=268821 /ORGANISM="Scrippsiella Hangoei, Strain SHTV-5" /LENGTH=428 /DNA_ID=CAMNT_0051174587 /DNA_START=391 /DNA_END=1677 /DNA_ORIENTATION=+